MGAELTPMPQTDIPTLKDIDPPDTRVLIEMYAYKYTKGVKIDEISKIVHAEHKKKDTGENCKIFAPLDVRSKTVPLQMFFTGKTGRTTHFYTYPDGSIYSTGLKGFEEDDERTDEVREAWLQHCEDFFGPLGLGEGIPNYYNTESYRFTATGEPIYSMSGGEVSYKGNFGPPKFYSGYKHSKYKGLFPKMTPEGRRAAKSIQAHDSRIEEEIGVAVSRYSNNFPEMSKEIMESILRVVFNSRKMGLTDKAIFYALAREFYPRLHEEGSSTVQNEIMKFLNGLYDSKVKGFDI